MTENRICRRVAGPLMILSLAIALPACQTAGSPPPMISTPEGSTTRRFSLRPILDGEGYRPFYLGGYAGASYGPGLFTRRVPVSTPAVQPAGPPSVTVDRGTWEPE